MKKGRVRRRVNQSLLETTERLREDWLRQKRAVENSIDPDETVLYELRLAEARYLFLLKEARVLFSDKPSYPEW